MKWLSLLWCVGIVAGFNAKYDFNLTFAKPVGLPAYNVDKYSTTVSGLSAGGYMVSQMHVAFSSFIKGAASFAGGPYNCANGNLNEALGPCMSAFSPPNLQRIYSTTESRSGSSIDDISNLADSRVYLFSGTLDRTVDPRVTDAQNSFYERYVTNGDIVYVNGMPAAHTQPTDDRVNTNACNLAAPPYISFCDYDGAGEALEHMWPGLNPRNDGTLTGEFVRFSQAEFIATGRGLAQFGWLYVPASCAAGAVCRLHIAFHGCQQNYDTINDRYVKHAGYNKWADSNNFLVLYPQTVSTQLNPQNPNGCFDWWGYNGNANTYDVKSGIQMIAMERMIDRLCENFEPLDPPTNLAKINTTDNTISVAWTGSAEASGYHVYRDGGRVTDAPLSAEAFTDTGLSSGTSFTYYVTAVGESGGESDPSTSITAQTTGDPPPVLPPANVEVTDATRSMLRVEWDVVANAHFNVYRDGSKVNTSPVQPTFYEDTGLEEETTYTYTITSVLSDSTESTPSTPATGTTMGGPCEDWTTENFNHLAALRAEMCGANVCAVGSGDELGTVLEITTLRTETEGVYRLGPCR